MGNRRAKANSAFGRLYNRVCNNTNPKKDTKINVYITVVLTTLLYGAESWVTYRRHLTSSPTSKSVKYLRLPASRPCSSKPSFACQKGTSENIRRYFVEVPRKLQYRSPSLDKTSNQSHELATYRLRGHHFL